MVSQPIPRRNLYQITDQLVLRPPRPISPVVRHSSPNYLVDHTDTFWVLSEDHLKYFKMRATIRARTPHLYLYVQDGVKVDHAAVQHAAATFEKHTYPTDRALYGSEWRPGVDGDPHITCLVGNLESNGTAGAFSAEDEYPRAVNPYSNAREMFYINTNTMPGTTDFDNTLAHEFQHMIHWHMHQQDEAWLNEGMSVLAQHLTGYSADYDGAYLADPTTQLDTWNANGDNNAHYGGAYLFLLYLYDRYGRGMIRTIVGDSRYTNFPLIDDALHKRHISTTADQLFADWVVANEVNKPTAHATRLGYHDLAYAATVNATDALPVSRTAQVPPYAPQYIKLPDLAGHAPLHLTFSGSPTVPLIGTSARGGFWWSNRGDMSDTRLERTIDLRHVRSAHLRFQAWWNIEKEYDFAFVEASTDGGKTWTTLPGTDTTTNNATGANYGHGYTGDSKAWRNETVDLSRYTGKQIKLRFEYITDDEVNLQGFLLRHITIPEIGFNDTFSGWHGQGFVRVDQNVLPARWTVQLVERTTHGVKAPVLALNAGQRGSVTIKPKHLGLKNLVVAVFMAAPKTTTKATYHLMVGGG